MKFRKLTLLTVLLSANFIVIGQSNEMERIINLPQAFQEIQIYLHKNKDFDSQIKMLKKYHKSDTAIIRKNSYLWLVFYWYRQ